MANSPPPVPRPRPPPASIVQFRSQNALRMRGLTFAMTLAWPRMNTGDVRRLGVEFGDVSPARVVGAEVSMSGVTLGAVDIVGNTVVFPVIAATAGQQMATVSVRTTSGDVQTASVGMAINKLASLVTDTLPDYADAAFVYGETYFPDPSGSLPLLMA